MQSKKSLPCLVNMHRKVERHIKFVDENFVHETVDIRIGF